MKLIADLHIHSKYARSCSNRLDVQNIWKYCIIKWIDLIWTWDFTHPTWLNELDHYLEDNGKWLFLPKKKYLKAWMDEIKPFVNEQVFAKLEKGHYPHFILQTEINSVFQRWEKKSRIHNIILIDSIKNAKAILDYLWQFGRVESDWRLAVKQDQIDTLSWLKTTFPQSVFIPAHIWTPYFGVLGSRFWFTSMQQAYWDSLKLVDAIETWLSSDPVMNWMNQELDNFAIVSNSDAHSLENFAREANVFDYFWDDFEYYTFDYKDLEKALKSKKYSNWYVDWVEKKYLDNLFKNPWLLTLDGTIEFYPQEGKYFGNWHAKCHYLTSPQDTIKRNGKCPICGWKIVVWVFHRSYDLWDQQRIKEIWFWTKDFWTEKEISKFAKKFVRPQFNYIVPLSDIITQVWQANKGTKKYEKLFNELIIKFWSEFFILLDLSLKSASKYDEKFAQALWKVREGDIFIKSGYDWLFGVVEIYKTQKEEESILEKRSQQDTLF